MTCLPAAPYPQEVDLKVLEAIKAKELAEDRFSWGSFISYNLYESHIKWLIWNESYCAFLIEPDKEKARLEQEKVEAWKKKQYDLNSFERKQLKKRGVKICPESDLEFASAFMIISFAISVPFENNSVWFQK